MNADRVEAAARALVADEGFATHLRTWEQLTEHDRAWYRTHAAIALAAADACEAERNPNPAEVSRRLHEIEKELAIGARDEARCYLTYAEARFLLIAARRSVSSEDVHREERT